MAVTIVGYGNSKNRWNGYSEVELCTSDTPVESPEVEIEMPKTETEAEPEEMNDSGLPFPTGRKGFNIANRWAEPFRILSRSQSPKQQVSNKSLWQDLAPSACSHARYMAEKASRTRCDAINPVRASLRPRCFVSTGARSPSVLGAPAVTRNAVMVLRQTPRAGSASGLCPRVREIFGPGKPVSTCCLNWVSRKGVSCEQNPHNKETELCGALYRRLPKIPDTLH